MEDCIFCKIIKGEIPTEKIYEDEDTLAFMDIRPVIRGHALVVPKNHSTDILDVEEQDLLKTLLTTRKVAEAIEKTTGAAGFSITTNKGEAAGQTIFHLHFHIIPRYPKDGLKLWTHHDTEAKTRAELAEQIKKHL